MNYLLCHKRWWNKKYRKKHSLSMEVKERNEIVFLGIPFTCLSPGQNLLKILVLKEKHQHKLSSCVMVYNHTCSGLLFLVCDCLFSVIVRLLSWFVWMFFVSVCFQVLFVFSICFDFVCFKFCLSALSVCLISVFYFMFCLFYFSFLCFLFLIFPFCFVWSLSVLFVMFFCLFLFVFIFVSVFSYFYCLFVCFVVLYNI